jgi:hypothetical protein
VDKKRTRLTRTELYEKAWATPMLQLAQEFGISDVGLAKLCRRHDIPLPGLGYWRKRETGRDPGRVPLPPASNRTMESIEIVASQKPVDIKALLADQAQPQVSVNLDGPITHPFALRTEKSLVKSKPGAKGLLVPKDGKAGHLLVSPSSLPRALKLLDAFLQACEAQHYSLNWPKEADSQLSVVVLDETIFLQLCEVMNAKAHELTREEQKHPWMAPKWDYEATGKLPYFDYNVRHSWGDAKQQRLEACLGKAVLGLAAASMAIKKEREERLRKQKEWEDQARIEEEARKRREEFKRRTEVLTGLMENWRKSRLVEDFLQALQTEIGGRTFNEEESRKIESFAEWTRAYAEKLNPFRGLMESVEEFLNPPKPKYYF